MDARKINIQRETPSLQDLIKNYFVTNEIVNVGNIVPNALDIMRMSTLPIPMVYFANTNKYIFVKSFHYDLVYTLSLWLKGEIELKDSFVSDPEDLKSTHYRRKAAEKYIHVDVIVRIDDNAEEVQFMCKLYNKI